MMLLASSMWFCALTSIWRMDCSPIGDSHTERDEP